MELFDNLQAWHWATLGIILLGLETLVSTGFLLGIGIAGLVLAVLVVVMPDLAWEWQFLWFGTLSVLLTLGYRKYFRNINEATDNPLLNDRAAQMIGKSFILGADLDRSGADMLGDTRWALRSSGRLASGTRVRVSGVDGMTLIVEEDS